MIRLYNSLTKKLDTLAPRNNTVRIYSCGPTVYDNIHIGNLSAFVASDTLRRVASQSYTVQHVMNFTDVDDKTIKRSQAELPDEEPLQALLTTTAKYSNIFLEDMKLIGNDIDALTFTKATEYIEEMKQLIVDLHAKGLAYISDDGVYFSIEAYQAAGKTYGQLTEITVANTSNQRINNDEYDKESVHDFALWKVAKPNEPSWSFEIEGQKLDGRPGWHIECSAMSSAQLGTPFDIHTGGIDLTFPHHENEIAQSTGAIDSNTYAQFFVHNEHLLVEGKKMSKSLQNFYTLRDIQEKNFEPLAFRLVILQSHYRSRTNFSWESIEAAQNRLHNLREFADLRFQATEVAPKLEERYFTIQEHLIGGALNEDLNTPVALSTLSEVISTVSNNGLNSRQQAEFESFIDYLDAVFGLQLGTSQPITEQQQQLIEQRVTARANNDWAESDRIRDELLAVGIGVRDTANGTIWYRS